MPSHLASIGLPVATQADFLNLANRVGPESTPFHVHSGTYWRWSSACGAELWLQTDTENNLIGMQPYFSGQGSIRVRVTARLHDDAEPIMDGSFHGWASPSDEDTSDGYYPFVFDVVDFLTYDDLSLPEIVEARIAAFAHEVQLFDSLEAYDAQDGNQPRFASKSFIPSGLFSPTGEATNPPQAFAIFTGHFIASAEKINTLTGKPYYWACVDTLGGSFDVVIDPELCDRVPPVGGVLSGSFYLAGRLLR